jgi:PTS system nitrogen regulatory IIA component
MQLSLPETARLLDVSEDTLYDWIRTGEIPANKVDEKYCFNRAELLEWATSRHIRISPELFHRDDEEGQLPSLSEALENGGAVSGIPGNDQKSVLRAVVDVLPLPEDVDRDFLYQVLLARESAGSTAVGNGIAIPHVRNPIVLQLKKPLLTLCYLANPIEFQAPDRKPVRILFTLISPTIRAHLHLLSRLAFALQDSVFSEILYRNSPQDELLVRLRALENGIVPG